VTIRKTTSVGFQPRTTAKRKRGLAASAVLAATATVLAACASGGGQADTSAASSGGGGQAPVANGAAQVKINLQSGPDGDQCVADFSSAPAGPVTFQVTNTSANGVSEVELLSDKRILGERENLVPGLPPQSFTVTLGGGTYQLYCPGAAKENVPFTVVGAAQPTGGSGGVQGLLQQGTKGYAGYVNDQVGGLVDAVAALQQAIASGNLQASQEAYVRARPYYERIEPVAESFPDLDPAIDARVNDVPPGQWTGFHRIEQALFEAKTTAGLDQLTQGLVDNVNKLKAQTQTLTYAPEELANGASGLLEEVLSTKITGEEERYSHIDLVDFAANIEGSQQSFEYLKPALQQIDGGLTNDVETQFGLVNNLLATYRDPGQPGQYRLYDDALKNSDGPKLSQAIQALQSPLSKIAEKVATA
jgi:iron uptake system component EfeO